MIAKIVVLSPETLKITGNPDRAALEKADFTT
jgi:hypothetical protein